MDIGNEAEMDIRGGDGPAQILLSIHRKPVLDSATDCNGVSMAGTTGQSVPRTVANTGDVPTSEAPLQEDPRPSVQTPGPTAEPQVQLPSPKESPSEGEGHQGEIGPSEDLPGLVEDILSAAVDEVVVEVTAEEHARRQADEAVQEIITGMVDEAVAADENRSRDREASVIVEDIFAVILELAAAALHPNLPQADDGPPPFIYDANVGTDAMDWSIVELQDDSQEEVVLLTDLSDLEEEDTSHVIEAASMEQLDGADETNGSRAATEEICRLSKTTGSGTVWASAALGMVGTAMPQPQTEAMVLGPMTRSQRRLMVRDSNVDV